MDMKHSGLGISSFILSILAGPCLFLVFVVAGIMEASTPGGIDEKSPAAVVVGLSFIAFLLLLLVSLGLGIGGLFQKDRKKLFAILGTIFSTGLILCSLLVLLVGLASG
jgi:hypothetical protein